MLLCSPVRSVSTSGTVEIEASHKRCTHPRALYSRSLGATPRTQLKLKTEYYPLPRIFVDIRNVQDVLGHHHDNANLRQAATSERSKP